MSVPESLHIFLEHDQNNFKIPILVCFCLKSKAPIPGCSGATPHPDSGPQNESHNRQVKYHHHLGKK